jgi:diguanylate cyclase (GGDEF)-like protein
MGRSPPPIALQDASKDCADRVPDIAHTSTQITRPQNIDDVSMSASAEDALAHGTRHDPIPEAVRLPAGVDRRANLGANRHRERVERTERHSDAGMLIDVARVHRSVHGGSACLDFLADQNVCRRAPREPLYVGRSRMSVARTMSLRMSYLAQHDFLTELPNRMLLNDRLTQAIASAHRHRTSLAVLFVDVDHFKRINDTLGHAIGDELLKSIAQRLIGCVRSSDTVSRQGGDEFLVLLSEVSRAEDAALNAAKILAALSVSHRIDQQDVHVTVSVGIGVYPDDGTDAETLLKNADAALFHAKAQGRNNHKFFKPEMNVGAGQRAF